MGDNLMEFNDSASEEKFVDDQDENDSLSSVPPKLVQSPVVVNSILKQSTKDNLIQLYTPVQKPEKGKLKVHFGSDSILETPNVKTGKKRVTDSRGIKFSDIKDDEISNNVKENSTETNTLSNTGNVEPSKETGLEKSVETNTTRLDDKDVTTSNNDETAMDISVCDSTPMNAYDDTTIDILRQAELLLQTLGHGDMIDTNNDKSDSKESQSSTTCTTEENTKPVENTNPSEDAADGLVISNVGNSDKKDTNNEEEAMDFEEDMEVDDEIVFKIPSGSKVVNGYEAVSENTKESIKQLDVTSKQDVNVTESEVKVTADNTVSDPNLNANEPEFINTEKIEEVLSTSLNGLVGCFEANGTEILEDAGKIVAAKSDTNDEKVDSNVNQIPEDTDAKKLPSPTIDVTTKKVTIKRGDDSSDEEFMSAGEEMDIDEDKTAQKSTGKSGIDQPIENKEKSPERIPPKVGYNLNFDDLEAMDPFSTKKSLMNSPDALKSGLKENKTAYNVDNSSETEPSNSNNENIKSEIDSKVEVPVVPQSPKVSNMPQPEILLSPNAALVDKVCQDENAASILDEAADCLLDDNMDKTSPEDQQSIAGESQMKIDDIPLKVKQFDFASLTEADLEAMDPFKPKKQVCNTPEKVKSVSDMPSDEVKPTSNVTAVEVKPASNDDVKLAVNEIHESIDTKINETNEANNKTSHIPIKTEEEIGSTDQTKVMPEIASNDDVKSTDEVNKVEKKIEGETKELPNTINEVKVESQSDTQSVTEATQIKEDTLSEVAKSPVIPLAKGIYNLDALDFDNMDPFKPKKQMMNSPSGKTEPSIIQDDNNPFEPKKQIMNSPVQKTVTESKMEGDNEPEKLELVSEVSVHDKNDGSMNNRAETNTEKVKLENDKPELVDTENESKIKTSSETVDVQVKKEYCDKKTEIKTETPLKKNISVDPFADLNPFKSSSKVSITPDKKPAEPENSVTNPDNIDDANPFESKICNSPETNSDPFVTKSNIANSPVKNSGSKVNCNDDLKLPSAVSTELPEENTDAIFEVHDVTRRGDDNFTQIGQFGEIDDMQFVSASQVFNDPAVWDMLEKFGTKSEKEESSLSRMSLYVKFDPLVDAAQVNPRRVSIRYSQLEKVKEYGVDDTFLLLGTPPKKRRQSVSSSQTRVNPPSVSLFGKSDEAKSSDQASVDLFFAESPTVKEQEEENNIMGQEGEDEFMSLLDRVGKSSENENLFQELKYTNADFEKFKTELKLVFQGNLMAKEKEWCAKVKALEDEKSNLVQLVQKEKKEKKELSQVMLLHEQTIEEVTAEKEAERKKKEEMKAERDQAMKDIQEIESAFLVLNTRFEKSKNVIQSLMKNNETFKAFVTDIQGKLKQQNEKYHTLEKTSETKNAENSKTIEKLTNQVKSLQEKCNTQQQLMQKKIDRLEKDLQSKIAENKELTDICDDLMTKI